MRRYLRLFAVQLRMSLLAALQYRVGFWSEGVLGLLWSMVGIVPLFVALEHRADVAGWGAWELVVLTGCFTAVQGVFGALLQPSLLTSMEHIRRGTLDYVLLRPADALFLCLTLAFNPWRLLELVGGMVLIGVGLFQIGRLPTPLELAQVLAISTVALSALYALGVLVLCASFRALQLQNLTFLLEALMDFARWPASVFRGLLKALFTFIVPFIVMTTYPAQALMGELAQAQLASAALTAAVFVIVARVLWTQSVRQYTSASS